MPKPMYELVKYVNELGIQLSSKEITRVIDRLDFIRAGIKCEEQGHRSLQVVEDNGLPIGVECSRCQNGWLVNPNDKEVKRWFPDNRSNSRLTAYDLG